jgi:hypothetical protein
MKTIAQSLRELKTIDLSESMLKDVELMEQINLRHAYHDALIRVPFEEWYDSNFRK